MKSWKFYFKCFLLISVITYLLLLTSCSTKKWEVRYSPNFTIQGDGTVSVKKFKYLAHKNGKVKPNQIECPGIPRIFIDKNVDSFITDSIRTELSFAGFSLEKNSNITIKGKILNLIADYRPGFIHRWSLSIKYDIERKSKNVYSKSIEVTTKTGPIDFDRVQNTLQNLLSKSNKQFLLDAKRKNIL